MGSLWKKIQVEKNGETWQILGFGPGKNIQFLDFYFSPVSCLTCYHITILIIDSFDDTLEKVERRGSGWVRKPWFTLKGGALTEQEEKKREERFVCDMCHNSYKFENSLKKHKEWKCKRKVAPLVVQDDARRPGSANCYVLALDTASSSSTQYPETPLVPPSLTPHPETPLVPPSLIPHPETPLGVVLVRLGSETPLCCRKIMTRPMASSSRAQRLRTGP